MRTIEECIEELKTKKDWKDKEEVEAVFDEILELNDENRWRYPAEELPEEDEEVIACINGTVDNITYCHAIVNGFFEEDGFAMGDSYEPKDVEVLAWRPLPTFDFVRYEKEKIKKMEADFQKKIDNWKKQEAEWVDRINNKSN